MLESSCKAIYSTKLKSSQRLNTGLSHKFKQLDYNNQETDLWRHVLVDDGFYTHTVVKVFQFSLPGKQLPT